MADSMQDACVTSFAKRVVFLPLSLLCQLKILVEIAVMTPKRSQLTPCQTHNTHRVVPWACMSLILALCTTAGSGAGAQVIPPFSGSPGVSPTASDSGSAAAQAAATQNTVATAGKQAPAQAEPTDASSALRRPRLLNIAALLGTPSEIPLEGSELDVPDEGVLTLRSAINIGLPLNLEVSAAEFRAESAVQTARSAQGALRLKFDLRSTLGKGRLMSAEPVNSLKRGEVSATIRQPIWDRSASMEINRQFSFRDSSDIQVLGARSSATLEIGNTYLQVLQTRLIISLSEEYEKLLQELLQYINERVSGGAASGADRDRVRARVANARSAISDTKANHRVAMQGLERLLDGKKFSSVGLVLDVDVAIPADMPDARSEAVARNHELRSARAELSAASFEIASYQGRFQPRIELELAYNKSRNMAGSPAQIEDLKAMVNITWSIYNGGSDIAQVRAGAARLSEQQALATNAERKIIQQLRSAYASLESVDERFKSVQEELESNRRVVDAFRVQLNSGNRNLLDVLDAYQRYHQSRLDLLQLSITEMQNQLRVSHLIASLGEHSTRPNH
jgi:adhesin transport system outer membrane protein